MPSIYYKVRQKGTELYSTGGSTPKWTKKGKVWSGIGSLKNHLVQVETPRRTSWSVLGHVPVHPYRDAEIVVMVMKETETMSPMEMLRDLRVKKDETKAKQLELSRKQTEEAERQHLRNLQAKYPDAV